MRSVDEVLRIAVQDKKSARMLVKAVIDPSRTFFATLTDDNPYDGGDYSVPTDTPVGQCTCYSPVQGASVTFIADSSTGVLYSMVQGSSSKNNLGITADENTKPAVWHRDNGTAYLWYCDDGGVLKRSTINMTSWGVSGTTTITVDYLPDEWTVTLGSPHALSETQIVYVYLTSIGGLGVGYHDGSRFYHWERRFMSPNLLTAADWSIYSTATVLNNRVFVYSTDLDTGEVRGVRFQPFKQKWSDSFTALPADLSRFDVGNAVQSGGFIHMAGQFHRTDDLADAKVYSLVLRSRDGFTFSWDRFTMLSSLGYQFQIGLDQGGKQVYASDRNSVGVADMSHFFTPVPTGRIEIGPPGDIINFSVSGASSASMQLKGYDEAFIDHATIKKGSKLQAYLGYLADGEVRWVKYQTYIIDAFNEGFGSGTRSISIGLADMASWMTSQLAFPFYSELLSKSSQYDDCDEIDRMYPVQTSDKEMFSFMYLDFWNNVEWDGDGAISGTSTQWRTSGPGCNYKEDLSNYQGATDQLLMATCDMKSQPFLSAYPTIGTLDVVARFYGWERTTADNRPNSNWYMYAITAPADDLDNKTVTVGTLTSSYRKWPQYDPGNEDGSYPIVFTWTTLTEDDVLLYFGFANQNSVAGISASTPERLEVEGVSFVYDQLKSASAWNLNNPDPASYGRKYLRMPPTGLPNVQFVTKPYTAFRFTMAADFIYDAGDEPLNKGKVGWGVVGIAKSGQDYILGRWLKGSTAMQIVSMRNGEETLLAVKSLTPGPEGVMMDHRDGLIRLWYRAAATDEWTGPYLEHQWDEITDGPMSTSSTGIMHMGIYAAVNPPGYLCTSFNPGDADGVCMIASSDDSVIKNFPTTGKVSINGVPYTYSGKTPTTGDYLGPYQGRQTWNYKRHEDSSIFGGGWGHENAIYQPDSAFDRMKDLLLGADNGHTWLIDKGTDWTVTHSTAGVQFQLLHRARHYGSNIGGNYVGPDNRTHLGPGLTGLEMVGAGDLRMHPYGALVSIYGTDQIWAKATVSTMVDRDATVKDMLRQLCNAASTETEFTGDWEDPSDSIGTTPVQLAATETLFPGGFDLYFKIPQLADGHSVTVYGSNIFIYDEEDPPVETAFVVEISVKRTGSILQVISHPTGGTRLDDVIINTDVLQSGTHDVRMLFHGEFCSVYLDRTSVATFAYGEDDLKWPTADVNLMMKCSATYTIEELLVCELFDWREAIYVESELTAASALGSVIQERPIEMAPTVDGGMSFSYNIVRETLTYSNAQTKNTFRSHQRVDRTVGDAGSDAIVYFADIGFVSHQAFADEEGFLTRVFKLATLDTGAPTAAYIMLEKAYETQFQHNITMRPDPRIEIGDRMEIHYLVPGTATQRDYALIVESIGIGIDEGRYVMSVSGREDELT
jgi:hypothetical protein